MVIFLKCCYLNRQRLICVTERQRTPSANGAFIHLPAELSKPTWPASCLPLRVCMSILSGNLFFAAYTQNSSASFNNYAIRPKCLNDTGWGMSLFDFPNGGVTIRAGVSCRSERRGQKYPTQVTMFPHRGTTAQSGP